MRRLFCILLIWTGLLVRVAVGAGKAEHVVVVVWDGLRPDSVTETNTPTLYKLAKAGVFFQNHHAVYLSSTEVNGVAMATGAFPQHSGVMANREFRPQINPLKQTEIESLDAVRKGDALSSNRYIALPTIAEILQRAGRKTALAGTKPVALLWDRHEEGRGCGDCANFFAGRIVPEKAGQKFTVPKFNPVNAPNDQQDAATTQMLTGQLWDGGVPTFSLLWLSEPDYTQHGFGPGSEKARQALLSSDRNLALVLAELEARGVRNKTDIFIVSDHGFSTIARSVDVAEVLQTAGFKAARQFTEEPVAGDIMVVGNGGSVLFYVIGHDPALTGKLVGFLQQQGFTGVIFTRETMEGTFPLELIKLNTAAAPDVVVSLRWISDRSATGVEGMLISDGKSRGPGQGNHTSLSSFDMRATLVAQGPDFRSGLINQLPSGNADLAPTILSILNIRPPEKLDGRELTEALLVDIKDIAPIESRTIDTTRDLKEHVWRQYLRVTQFGGTTYFDEGNGFAAPK